MATIIELAERTVELAEILRLRVGELEKAQGYSRELHRVVDARTALSLHAKTLLREAHSTTPTREGEQ